MRCPGGGQSLVRNGWSWWGSVHQPGIRRTISPSLTPAKTIQRKYRSTVDTGGHPRLSVGVDRLLLQMRNVRIWPMSAMLAQAAAGPNPTVNGRQRARSQAEVLETSLRAYSARLPTPRRRPAKQPETSELPRRSCLGSHALRRSMDKSRRVDCAHLGPTEVPPPATRRRDTQVNQVIASYSPRSVSGREVSLCAKNVVEQLCAWGNRRNLATVSCGESKFGLLAWALNDSRTIDDA